jgi:histidyl-tRNA synthetase
MFRQERPQAGRLRQFNQFGAEAIGSSSPLLDVEMIQMSYNILTNLGLKDLAIKINSLGVPESRENYKNMLREYLKDIKDNLSEDSRIRFDTNILRIFDSKSPVDQKILKDAPKLIDHLDEESKADYEIVKEQLEKSNIKFEVDPALVRGLDYYTKLTFEIISGSVGAQSALCGGGRYDLLIETLGGKPTPATGFAAGIERILLACENEKSFTVPDDSLDIYIIRLEKELESVVSEFAYKLRKQNLAVDFDYLQRSVKAQMREANKMNANFTLFVGGEEYEQEMITLKNMESGKEEKMLLNDMDNLVNLIKNG